MILQGADREVVRQFTPSRAAQCRSELCCSPLPPTSESSLTDGGGRGERATTNKQLWKEYPKEKGHTPSLYKGLLPAQLVSMDPTRRCARMRHRAAQSTTFIIMEFRKTTKKNSVTHVLALASCPLAHWGAVEGAARRPRRGARRGPRRAPGSRGRPPARRRTPLAFSRTSRGPCSRCRESRPSSCRWSKI